MNPTETTAMIFAAGLGTRLQPFTLNAPKALYPVNEKPLLQRNIEYLQSFGINRFVINVHHFADQIILFLKDNQNFGAEIQISNEKGELLETGGGLLKAEPLLGKNAFVVMNADILTHMPLNEMMEFHSAQKPLITLAVSDRNSSRKLLFNSKNLLCGWKDYKNQEEIICDENYAIELAFSGIHIIEPEFFELNKFQGKFSIMKSYMDLMKSEKIVGFNHSGYDLVDVGKPESVAIAENLFP